MIKFPAYLTSFRSKSDGSAGITFSTQELSPEQFMDLKRHLNNFGWLLFKEGETEIPDGEVPKEKLDDDSKSPSERLYNVLYVYWKQNVNEGSFDLWRKRWMEQKIEQIKSQLKQ